MITKNYIKMCEEAKEIQKAWKPVDWDRFIYKDDREFGIACVNREYDKKDPNTFWLPTQEQLQEMMEYKFSKERKLLSDFYGWVVFKMPPFVNETMKEMLLMYVMKEKWDKEWDDNKWK